MPWPPMKWPTRGNNQVAWTLSGDDAGDFSIGNGELTFNTPPDREAPADADTDNVYLVTVEASAGGNTAALDVTVTVTEVNEPPAFPDDSGTRSIPENTQPGEPIGEPVKADDPEGDDLKYSLGGDDADSFDIDPSTGQLMTKDPLDHEEQGHLHGGSVGQRGRRELRSEERPGPQEPPGCPRESGPLTPRPLTAPRLPSQSKIKTNRRKSRACQRELRRERGGSSGNLHRVRPGGRHHHLVAVAGRRPRRRLFHLY